MTPSERARPARIAHAPRPGPEHWAWRCLICDAPVDEHAGWLRRLWERAANANGDAK